MVFIVHEIVYTVTAHPVKTSQFAITHLSGAVTDENLLAIGFVDPYPGTPLPCLSRGEETLFTGTLSSVYVSCA